MDMQDSNETKNFSTKIYMFLSCIAWIAASINNWCALNWLYSKNHRALWNIYIFLEDEVSNYQAPFQMHYIMNYIVFNFAFAIIFISCIIFLITLLFKNDEGVINGMFGKFSKFHFFPLLCCFGLDVLGELGMDEGDLEAFHAPDKAGLAISLVGLISMIFVYIFTDLKSKKWWVNFFLKNGAFSCLIVLFFYDFCYDVYYCRAATRNVYFDFEWIKGCGIFFSIFFGLCCLIFSFAFKDIMISFMNILIYIGMTIYYFQMDEDRRSRKQYNRNGDGIVDVIILSFSIILFFYLLVDRLINKVLEMKGALPLSSEIKVDNNTEVIKINPRK